MSDLFIIGAGASVPYGFPDGEVLLKDILRKAAHYKSLGEAEYENEVKYIRKFYGSTAARNMRYIEPYPEELDIRNNFIERLQKNPFSTIDAFLRDIPEFADVGKRFIINAIIEKEKDFLKKRGYNENDWLNHLIDNVGANDRLYELFFNSSFIIFNYDRLFEHIIFNYLSIKESNASREEVLRKIDNMNIIHIHGSIGKLNNYRFGEDEDLNYDDIVEKMKTVWEKDYKYKDTINSYLKKANQVFFIGFGWSEDNMKALGIENNKNLLKNKEIYGTAFGKAEYDVLKIIEELKSYGAIFNEKNTINNTRKARDLILEFYRLPKTTIRINP